MSNLLTRGVVALTAVIAVTVLSSGHASAQPPRGQPDRAAPRTVVVVIKEHVFRAEAPNDPQKRELRMRKARGTKKGEPTQYELEAGRDWVFCENGGEVGVLGVMPVVYTDMDGYKPIPAISKEEEGLMRQDNKILVGWLLGRVGAIVSMDERKPSVGPKKEGHREDEPPRGRPQSLQKDLDDCEAWLRHNRDEHMIRYRLARAAIYAQHQKADEAEKEMEKALELAPQNQCLKRMANKDR